jgi:hypothetical protein
LQKEVGRDNKKMADVTSEEIESLQREFDWVLSTEVQSVIEQLRAAVQVKYSLFRIRIHWIRIQAVAESGSTFFYYQKPYLPFNFFSQKPSYMSF